MAKQFEFDLYRMNLVDEDLFEFMGSPIRAEKDILAVLEAMTAPEYDFILETSKSAYKWSTREYFQFPRWNNSTNDIAQIILSRSLLEQAGQTVTDNGIEDAVSEFEPPLATSIICFFWLNRHIVAVEHNSALMGSAMWRKAFHRISNLAAKKAHYTSRIKIEPIPQHEELIKAFQSFSRVVRLRVKLRLPNPDLSRYTRRLYQELHNGGIREYLQDMKNPNGLSSKEGALPHASISLAEEGYKDGNVSIFGVRNGRIEKEITGKTSARGKLSIFRDFVRGMKANAKAKETHLALTAIIQEIDRISPSEEIDEDA